MIAADRSDVLPVVDAHHHFWQLGAGPLRYPWLQDSPAHPFFLGDHRAICRDFLPADYRRESGACQPIRVVKTVHVEAECDRSQQVAETQWLAQLHADTGMPHAIVAHAWLHTDNSEDVLAAHKACPLVRGIRSKPVTSASPGESVAGAPGSMQDPRWLAGLRRLVGHGFSWDLRVPAWHLEEAAAVARTNPDLPIVLNHTGFPWDRSEAGLALWRRGMRMLATCPNVYCKISCLCEPKRPWSYEGNRRIVLETLEFFGPARCMVASNFPVDSLCVRFATLFDDLLRMTAECSAAERRYIFHDTAVRFYRL